MYKLNIIVMVIVMSFLTGCIGYDVKKKVSYATKNISVANPVEQTVEIRINPKTSTLGKVPKHYLNMEEHFEYLNELVTKSVEKAGIFMEVSKDSDLILDVYIDDLPYPYPLSYESMMINRNKKALRYVSVWRLIEKQTNKTIFTSYLSDKPVTWVDKQVPFVRSGIQSLAGYAKKQNRFGSNRSLVLLPKIQIINTTSPSLILNKKVALMIVNKATGTEIIADVDRDSCIPVFALEPGEYMITALHTNDNHLDGSTFQKNYLDYNFSVDDPGKVYCLSYTKHNTYKEHLHPFRKYMDILDGEEFVPVVCTKD